MNETPAELETLQNLLDRSAGDTRRHLTDIIGPQRRLSAQQLSRDLFGILVLNVATVTAAGEPRLSAVDGQFLHGHWYFSTATGSYKARHLATRPAVSVAYTPRDGYGVWAHGTAAALDGAERERIDSYLSEVYGQPMEEMAEGIEFFRVDAHWLIGYAMTAAEQAEFDAGLPARDARVTDALAAFG